MATTKVTGEQRVAKLFGLEGESWARHANPVSVWTRFAVLPLLAVSVWSRDWTGILILQAAKAWYIDRQVLLFEDMKGRHPQYAAWEY